MISCQRLIFAYEVNNAGNGMRLWAQTANEKFKYDAQTQDVDGMQTFSMFYMTKSDALSQQWYV